MSRDKASADHCLSATVAWGCGERSAEEERERRKMRKIIQKERDGGGGVGERTEVANHNTVEYRQTKSLMVRD